MSRRYIPQLWGLLAPAPFSRHIHVEQLHALSLKRGFTLVSGKGRRKKREETEKEKEARRQVKNLFPHNVYLVKSDCLLKIGNK